MLPFLAPLALAQDPEPAPVPLERDWALVDRRALKTFKAGEVLGVAGAGAFVLGYGLGSPLLVYGGYVSEAVALPLMSGASFRSRRALYEQGSAVRATPGALAWTLWGVGLLAGGAASTALAAGDDERAAQLTGAYVALRVGGYVCAGLQGGANKRARRRLALRPTGT